MGIDIHPSAGVDESARLGDGCVVERGAVIEADVVLGRNCRVMAGAIIHRFTHMGDGNTVHPYAVLGGLPQDLKFDPTTETYLRIGSNNTFREYSNFSRATAAGAATVIGDGGYFMAGSHAGHDAVIGDRVIFTNGAAASGHTRIGSGVILSGYTVVHQFVRVGDMVMTRGLTAIGMHTPPYTRAAGINLIRGLNVVGLRRAEGLSAADREQVKQAYKLVYRSGLRLEQAVAEMDARDDWGEPAGRFREFCRQVLADEPPYNRGLIADRAFGGR